MRKYRIVLGILAVIFFIGCNDNYPEISEGLFEKDKMDVIKDSITEILAYTVSDEDAITSPVTLGLVGVHNDDVFGKTKAGFAFQLRTPSKYTFEENAIVDSAYLYLLYDKVHYDSTFVQNMNIFQLEGAGLDFTDKYRANEIDRISLGEKIAEKDFNYAAIVDTLIVFVRNDTIKSQVVPEHDSLIIVVNDTLVSDFLRVKIPNEYAQRVFIDEATPDNYASQQDFLSYFKGLYIETDDFSDKGGLYAFDISSGFKASSGVSKYSYLNVSYSYPGDTVRSVFGFYAGENSARVNFVTHDYTGSEVERVIGEVAESESLYIKGAAGTAVKLYINAINNWRETFEEKKQDLAINKAELVISVATDSIYNLTNPVPDKLVMVALDEEGNPFVLPDYSLSTYDGNYDIEDNTYKFNITFYLQQLVKNKENFYGFKIYPSNRREDPRGVVIANPNEANGTDKRIKLSITYTKIK